MTLEHIVQQRVREGILALYGKETPDTLIQVQKTRKEFEGDYTLVVFPLVKLIGKNPEQAGNELGKYLSEQSEEITGFNVVKGFLNLSIADTFWIRFLSRALQEADYGLAPAGSKGKVMVEYSSPNTNKPLHLGHLRNNFLGFSVSEILKAAGHDVIRVQVINDRGIHICKSMIAWKKFGQGETPGSSGMKGDKLVGKYYVLFDQACKSQIRELVAAGKSEEEAAENAPIMLEAREMLRKWEERDPETLQLWQTMNGWVYAGFEATYKAMGVAFDKLYYESETYLKGRDEVLKGLEKGVFYRRDDGSIWCDLRENGLDEKLLLRKDSTAVYMTQDIGTAILRFEDFPGLQKQIYTVGNEQEYHFRVLFLLLEKLGYAMARNNFHLSYGMVELPEGKMKSREGTVVDADDLMEEMDREAGRIADEQGKLEGFSNEERSVVHHQIGMAALKYFLLRVDPRKNMLFDPRESIDFNGNTGPFIQYAYVRTRSLFRKSGLPVPQSVRSEHSLLAEERVLLKRLYHLPEFIAQSAESYDPSHLAAYCYELAREFNAFYHVAPVLKEEDVDIRDRRLAMAELSGRVLRRSLSLLGIDCPERM
jgi:arginyl-tRNA synthetase